MKNKIISSLTALALLACILYTPVSAFLLEMSDIKASFATVASKSFSKNALLKNNFNFKFNDFTDNITAKKKTSDFSSDFALMDKNAATLLTKQNSSAAQKQIKQEIPAGGYISYGIIDRLRTRADLSDTGLAFVFFILLYIGMLRSVYVFKRNKSYIKYFKTSVC